MPTVYSGYTSVDSATTEEAFEIHKPLGKMHLFILEPEIVFQARVNQPTQPTYPIDFIPFDGVTLGAFGDAKTLMRVAIGSAPGLSDYGYQRIRVNSEADRLHVGRTSQGRLAGELDLVDDAYITVYDLMEVWGRVPHIEVNEEDPNDLTATQWKDADLDFATHGLNPPPVARMGIGFAATIDPSTGVITVSFSGADSFTTADGATITDYLWDVKDGTIIVGTTTSSSIKATFPAGFRWVWLTVTDSNGSTMIARRPVYARDPEADTTIPYWVPEQHQITSEGSIFSATIRTSISRSTYIDGTLAMIWQGEPEDEFDRSHMIVPCGYLDLHNEDIEASRTATLPDTSIQIVDVAGKMKEIGVFSQMVQYAEEPDAWHEMQVPNMDKLIHYLLWWHSTALQLSDYFPSGTGDEYVFTTQEADGSSLWDQVDREAKQMIPEHRLTCDSYGRLHVVPYPNLQPVGNRTAVVQADLIEDDWVSIRYDYKKHPKYYWLRSSAVRAHIVENIDDLGTYFCIAPGKTPGQGEAEQVIGNKLVPTQSLLNICEGHRYALLNTDLSKINIELLGGDRRDIEPALLEWITLTVDAGNLAYRAIPFTVKRMIPLEVNVRYDVDKIGTVKTVTVTAEPEIQGTAATTHIPTVSTDDGDTGMPPDHPDDNPGGTIPPPGPPDGGLEGGQELVVGIDLQGTGNFIFRTFDFQTPDGSGGPTWEEVTLTTGETNHFSWVVDPFSPGYLGSGSAINGWVAGNDGIWKLTDLFGDAGATEQRSFSVSAVGGSYHWRQIGASFGAYFPAMSDNPWLLCISYYADTAGHEGTWATYSLDAGVTWSDEVQISAFYHSGTPDQFMPNALWMSPRTPGFALAGAFAATGNPPTGAVYYTVDWGATWSLYGSSEPPSDPDEPVPWWGHYDHDLEAGPNLNWGRFGYLEVNVEREISGTESLNKSLVFIGPSNLKRVLLHGVWTSGTETSAPVWTTQLSDVNDPTATGYTEAEDYTQDTPGDNEVNSGEFYWEIIEAEAGANWPADADDPQEFIDNYFTLNVAAYPHMRLSMGVTIVGSGRTARAHGSIEFEVIEMENQDGLIYVPPIQTAGLFDPINRLAGMIHVPWPDNLDEGVVYHGAMEQGATRIFTLIRVTGETIEDVSPSNAGITYGANRGLFTIRSHDSNRNFVVASLVGNSTTTAISDDKHAIFVSDDGGDTWTMIVGPLANGSAPAGRAAYEAAFGGDSEQIIFIWGPANSIAYSEDFGATVDDRSGNLAALGVGGFIGIAGGPT